MSQCNGEYVQTQKIPADVSDYWSERVLSPKAKAVITFQFISVGLVFAFGPCAALQFFFDSVINHIWIMCGGFLGSVLSFFLLKFCGLRYTVIILYAWLLLGWMCTFWTIKLILTFESSASLYFCFFLNGVAVGMLMGALLPHLRSYCSAKDRPKDLYFWPQLGILLGVCIVEVILALDAWQITLVVCMIIAAISLFTSQILPRGSPYSVEIKAGPGLGRIYGTTGRCTKEMTGKYEMEHNDSPYYDTMTPKARQMKAAVMVGLQHFTGLSLISLVEVIGVNLSKNPQKFFQIFVLFSLLCLLGIRMLFVEVPTQIVLPSGIMSMTYMGLAYMYYASQDSGTFYNLPAMILIVTILGICIALGKFYMPMVEPLLDLPSKSYHLAMLIILTSWWGFGLIFSLIFASLLFSSHLSIVFLLMSVFSLIATVICKTLSLNREAVICQLF